MKDWGSLISLSLRLTPGFGQITNGHGDATWLRTKACPTGQVIEKVMSGDDCSSMTAIKDVRSTVNTRTDSRQLAIDWERRLADVEKQLTKGPNDASLSGNKDVGARAEPFSCLP